MIGGPLDSLAPWAMFATSGWASQPVSEIDDGRQAAHGRRRLVRWLSWPPVKRIKMKRLGGVGRLGARSYGM